jgi:hypothetical protein
MTKAEWALIVVLRCGAAVLMLAALAVVMPFSWMAATHELLGLGTLPDIPLIQYLTRSVSAFYAYHGVLILLLSFDVRRYAPVIRFIAWTTVVCGGLLLALDLWCGMPWFWTLAEGPSVVAFGLLLVLLRPARS